MGYTNKRGALYSASCVKSIVEGTKPPDAIRQIGVSEVRYWAEDREVMRLNDLELENSRLRKAVFLTLANAAHPVGPHR